MRTKKVLAGAAVAMCAAGAAAGVWGAGSATAADNYSVTLSRAETAVIATHGLGDAFSNVPQIPTVLLNPHFGRMIQMGADDAASEGGCIRLGITRGASYTSNSVSTLPAGQCR
ncbi:hypothetical protein MUG78_05440 [Gordonia alkaliphila]|uniref:hypothetical protein n=1 Tax=Gordonia alkaliphila TaxID=1053547 RepID=UPI001FF13CEB|nr:hypothetical protein [Gordonia alkaliphila]MCK0438923.1 hypothetical protein [Gordonia alkaliphila]